MHKKLFFLTFLLIVLALSTVACAPLAETPAVNAAVAEAVTHNATSETAVSTTHNSDVPIQQGTDANTAQADEATYLPTVINGIQDLTYAIVDTGQSVCYNNNNAINCPAENTAFYGQDAQFNGNQPSYTLSADGLTVYDNVTGLTWTQSPDLNNDGSININDKLTFAEAQAFVNSLNAQNFGGYNDWRLPSMKELYSLMDFSGTDPSGPNPSNLTPFIDTDTFEFAYGDESAGERIIDAQFWSSNVYVGTVFGNQTAAFGLNLADGRIKGYPTSGKLNYVYFVRGNTAYGINDFANNGDGTITDNATSLMWAQEDSGPQVNAANPTGEAGTYSGMTWEEALAWVDQMNDQNYLGYSDWRLPNAKEMQSILDYDRAPDATNSAAIDPIFSTTQIINEAGQTDYPSFWTSTTHVKSNGSGSSGVYISFGRAMGYMNNTWMDVHGAGAQRSDSKTGDPADYPTGHGPQGDAIRIYNYVRLVRDGEAQSTSGADVSTLNISQSDDMAQPPRNNQLETGNGQLGTNSGQQGGLSGQEGSSGAPQMPDLTAAAAQLGVSEQALIAALGEPGQGPPDFATVAAALGVTEAELIAALGIPAGGMPPGGPGGQQQP